MASLTTIPPCRAKNPLLFYIKARRCPAPAFPLQSASASSGLNFSFRVPASTCLWFRRRLHRAHGHVCTCFHVGVAANDAVCTAAVFAGAYAWIRTFDFLGEKKVLEQNLSRKLIHVSSGILFLLAWPLFSTSPWSRFFALTVPVANATRLAVNGFGILKDEGFVKSISRGGASGELLRGPLYYALVLSCCTLCFWRDSPVGTTAIAIMCGGDGVADIVGRRIGGIKLPHNTRKSWAGSISMFVFGFGLSICLLYYFSSLGYYNVDWSNAVQKVALISFVATVVESLPVSNFFDDNISVPLVAVIMGMAFFPNTT